MNVKTRTLVVAIGAALMVLAAMSMALPSEEDGQCPEPLRLIWAFGAVTGGTEVQVTRKMSDDLVSILAAYPYAGYERTSTSLPAGVTFDLVAPIGLGTLAGTLPAGGPQTVVYAFVDRVGCPMVELTVRIDGEGGSPVDPGATPAEASGLGERDCSPVLAVRKTPGFLFTLGTVDEVPVRILVGGVDARTTPFDLCASAGEPHTVTLTADPFYAVAGQDAIPFAGWERSLGDGETWTGYGSEATLDAIIDDAYVYRAVYEQAPAAQAPVVQAPAVQAPAAQAPAATTVCLTVRAGYGTNPLPVPLLVNGTQEKTALFEVCVPAGTRLTVQAPGTYVSGSNSSEFLYWERYSKLARKWERFEDANAVTVTVVEKGQIRAVYTEPTQAAPGAPGLPGITSPAEPTSPPGLPGISSPPEGQETVTSQAPAATTVCLTVRAGYGANPLPVPLLVNGTDRRTALFEVCVAAGTRLTVQAPATYESGGNRSEFQYWERYNKIARKWERFSDANAMTVIVAEKRQIRAVYTEPTQASPGAPGLPGIGAPPTPSFPPGLPGISPPTQGQGTGTSPSIDPGSVTLSLPCIGVTSYFIDNTKQTPRRYVGANVEMRIGDDDTKLTPFDACCIIGSILRVHAPEMVTRSDGIYRFIRWEQRLEDEDWELATRSRTLMLSKCSGERRAVYELAG